MEKKLRHSHQRDMIYNYLLSTKEHPSAEMIYDELRRIEPTLSLGTVYRNLKLLEDLGMVKKVTSVNNVERYDAMTSDHIQLWTYQILIKTNLKKNLTAFILVKLNG